MNRLLPATVQLFPRGPNFTLLKKNWVNICGYAFLYRGFIICVTWEVSQTMTFEPLRNYNKDY